MHNTVANGVDGGFGAVLHFQFLEQGFGMGRTMTSHRPFFPRRPVLPVAATNVFQRRHLQNSLAILR
ncbi:MAG TPA: hypothetical protein VF430_08620, partial [Verrucomicrobiae bacterium]